MSDIIISNIIFEAGLVDRGRCDVTGLKFKIKKTKIE